MIIVGSEGSGCDVRSIAGSRPRPVIPITRGGWRGAQEGSGVKRRALATAHGPSITPHVPLTFKQHGGRTLVVTPDGAEWGPRPRLGRQHHGQGADGGVPVE